MTQVRSGPAPVPIPGRLRLMVVSVIVMANCSATFCRLTTWPALRPILWAPGQDAGGDRRPGGLRQPGQRPGICGSLDRQGGVAAGGQACVRAVMVGEFGQVGLVER